MAIRLFTASPFITSPALAQQPVGGALPSGPSVKPSDFGLSGRYAQDATDAMQAMFDGAPSGAIIDFADGMDEGGDYRITRTVVIRKHLSLRGRNSRIVGDMRDNRTDLVRYEPTSELRGALVEGLRLGFNAGGRDALVFSGGEIGVIGNVVSRCAIMGGAGGYAVRLAGRGNHFNVVRDCTLTGTASAAGAVIVSSADGNKLLDNVIGGIGTGVRLELINGAYKTGIIGGAIVSRDGGVRIIAGQQIDIERVQFEQGTGNPGGDRNRADYKAHIVIAGVGRFPDGEEVRDIRIVACNFGSGSNQVCAITLVAHARDVFIDQNYFASIGTDGVDVAIDSREVFFTRLGPNNQVGGNREGIQRGTTNSADPKNLFKVRDRGTGTYGVYKSADTLQLSAGWRASPEFAFWKTEDDLLRFRSTLEVKGAQRKSQIGLLPVGFRPLTLQRVAVPTEGKGTAILTVDPNGRLIVEDVADGTRLYLDQIALPVQGRDSFVSGPY